MTRDYARLCATGRRRRYSKKQSHAGLWVFTIFLFVIFTFGLVFLGRHQQSSSHPGHVKKEQKETIVQKQKVEQEVHLPPLVQQEAKETSQDNSSRLASARHKNSVAATTAAVAPQFEFTTPEALEQATAQKIAAENSERGNKKVSADTSEQVMDHNQAGQYVLDVIKTKNKVTAEKMRARLALVGVESNVVTVQEQKSTYYKITLGPYGKNTALAKQKLLSKNSIKASLGKVS